MKMLSPNEIDDIETETSNLILAAELGRSPEAFKKAALKEISASSTLEKQGIRRFVHHLFSAGWCAVHAKDRELARSILEKIDEIADLDEFFSKAA